MSDQRCALMWPETLGLIGIGRSVDISLPHRGVTNCSPSGKAPGRIGELTVHPTKRFPLQRGRPPGRGQGRVGTSSAWRHPLHPASPRRSQCQPNVQQTRPTSYCRRDHNWSSLPEDGFRAEAIALRIGSITVVREQQQRRQRKRPAH